MCGPLEYAQPPYFYLPSVGVVTTDILSNRKASAWGLSADLTNDDDDDDDDDDDNDDDDKLLFILHL